MVKEDTSTGDIRGLGYVTGDPKSDDDALQSYIERNIATADTHTDILNKVLQKMHTSYHSKVVSNFTKGSKLPARSVSNSNK